MRDIADDPRTRLRALTDLATPWAVHVAATLRLADLVADGATTTEELARRAGADEDTLARLLYLLVAQGVFDAPRAGEVALNDVSRLLLDEAGWRQWLDLDGAPGIGAESWAQLLGAVRTGGPERDEQAYYGRLAAEPERWQSFDELMAAQVAATATALASAYDWTGVEQVVDVGGGTGTLLRALLGAHAHLRGTLVELPEVAAKARVALAEAGLADRCQVVEGSFRESLLDPGDATSTGFDLFMLALGGGRQRTLDDFGALAEQSGLRVESTTRLDETPTDLVVLG